MVVGVDELKNTLATRNRLAKTSSDPRFASKYPFSDDGFVCLYGGQIRLNLVFTSVGLPIAKSPWLYN